MLLAFSFGYSATRGENGRWTAGMPEPKSWDMHVKLGFSTIERLFLSLFCLLRRALGDRVRYCILSYLCYSFESRNFYCISCGVMSLMSTKQAVFSS